MGADMHTLVFNEQEFALLQMIFANPNLTIPMPMVEVAGHIRQLVGVAPPTQEVIVPPEKKE